MRRGILPGSGVAMQQLSSCSPAVRHHSKGIMSDSQGPNAKNERASATRLLLDELLHLLGPYKDEPMTDARLEKESGLSKGALASWAKRDSISKEGALAIRRGAAKHGVLVSLEWLLGDTMAEG